MVWVVYYKVLPGKATTRMGRVGRATQTGARHPVRSVMATQFCANCSCPSCVSIKSSPVQVKRPKSGTLTGQVWDICDTLAGQGEVTRKAVIAAGTLKGLNQDTIKTQYQAWLSARKQVAAAQAGQATQTEQAPSVAGPIGPQLPQAGQE